MSRVRTGVFNIEGLTIPFHLKMEYRNSVRYSIGRKRVNIKLPILFTSSKVEKELDKVQKWLHGHLLADEKLRNKFTLKRYEDGDTYTVRGIDYTLRIQKTNNKSNGIKLYKDNILGIKLEPNLTDLQRYDVIQRLFSRFFGKMYLSDITQRVHLYNDKFFKQHITNVRLKYNKSNWGSCSSKNNINLSTRLLLAPSIEIVDYVIVHELSHLLEMNHSPAFWQIVKNVMPNYKVQEAWLNEYGHTLDF